MAKINRGYLFLMAVLLLYGIVSSQALACTVFNPYPTTTNNNHHHSAYNHVAYDYTDAPGYEDAWHATDKYQKIGTEWNSESSPRDIDTSDDGVLWSTDGGITWGHDDVTVGQTVDFKVVMSTRNIGTHVYDGVKTWIDWNADGDWLDDGELILTDIYTKSSGEYSVTTDSPEGYSDRNWTNGDTGDWVEIEFIASVVVPEYAALGETWLLARVTCDNSIGGATYYDGGLGHYVEVEGDMANLLSSGYLNQGEAENWALNVNAVPLPASLLLFCTGLVGIASTRRKKNNK